MTTGSTPKSLSQYSENNNQTYFSYQFLNRNSYRQRIDNVQTLKKQNQLLKKKLNQLTLALDVSLNKTQSVVEQNHQSSQQDQLNQREQFKALNDMLKQKDIKLIEQKQSIEELQNQIWSYKNKGYLPNGYDKIMELQSKLKETETKNQELSKELKSMHKIQVEQGRALEKITDENDYPIRIKAMVEELRYTKERSKILEQKLRNEEKINKQNQEHMIRLEETIREMKGISRKNMAIAQNGKTEVNKPYHLMKADEKIEELNRVVDMLTKTKEKDYKNFHFQKKQYEKQIKELQAQLEEKTKLLSERDKELKLQGFKLRQLMQEEYRGQFVKKNFEQLDRLASPKINKRTLTDQEAVSKLDDRKQIQLKYGKLPLKPGFNKRKLDFKEKMDLLDIEIYGSEKESRARSVDPLMKAKYKRLNHTVLDLNNAADQIIENSMNQFRAEVQYDEEIKQKERDDRDYLEQLYDEVGGKVFDINHDLNVNTNPVYNSRV
eukprot:403349026